MQNIHSPKPSGSPPPKTCNTPSPVRTILDPPLQLEAIDVLQVIKSRGLRTEPYGNCSLVTISEREDLSFYITYLAIQTPRDF